MYAYNQKIGRTCSIGGHLDNELIVTIDYYFYFFLAYGQSCPEPDISYADPRQCDKYVQCTDGVPEEKLCPDGLVFNEKLEKLRYPCDYPAEVDCTGRNQLRKLIRQCVETANN